MRKSLARSISAAIASLVMSRIIDRSYASCILANVALLPPSPAEPTIMRPRPPTSPSAHRSRATTHRGVDQPARPRALGRAGWAGWAGLGLAGLVARAAFPVPPAGARMADRTSPFMPPHPRMPRRKAFAFRETFRCRLERSVERWARCGALHVLNSNAISLLHLRMICGAERTRIVFCLAMSRDLTVVHAKECFQTVNALRPCAPGFAEVSGVGA